jgi:hypothetical protein
MLSRCTTKNLILILLAGSCQSSKAANLPPAEFVSVFSSYKVYPATGDCGGQTLTIVRDDQSRLIRGYLQTYEGNCEDSKVPITNVQFNSDKGALSFAAPTYVQDGKGGLMIFAERRFVGVIEKNRVKGKLQYCPIDSNSCTSSGKVNLPAVAKGTP